MNGDSAGFVDATYLFLCAALWRRHALEEAMNELVSALDSPDPDVNMLLSTLMEEASPGALYALAACARRRWRIS